MKIYVLIRNEHRYHNHRPNHFKIWEKPRSSDDDNTLSLCHNFIRWFHLVKQIPHRNILFQIMLNFLLHMCRAANDFYRMHVFLRNKIFNRICIVIIVIIIQKNSCESNSKKRFTSGAILRFRRIHLLQKSSTIAQICMYAYNKVYSSSFFFNP